MRNDNTRNGADGRSAGTGDAFSPWAGRDAPTAAGEVTPWQDGELDPAERGADLNQPRHGGADPARQPASVTIRMPVQEPAHAKKTVRMRRSVLTVLICLILLLALAVVALVKYLPAHQSTALATQDKTTGTPSASATQPSPAASASSASASPSAAGSSPASSPAASASGAGSSASAIAAPGGAAGAPLADLSALNPVEQNGIGDLSTGPQQIGPTNYEDSVRFTCYASGDVVYDVAGYKYLTTLIGVPSDASNAAGNAMTITFYKDGSATQLMAPVTVSLDHPQSVHLNLQGSSQLEVACSAINTTNQDSEYMDVAFGNATIGSS